MPSLGRGSDDDAAAAIRDEMRCDRTDGVESTGQIDVDLVVPVGIFHVENRPKRLDAGIGKQDVDFAEFSVDHKPAGPAMSMPATTAPSRAKAIAVARPIPRRSILRWQAPC